MSNDFVNDDEMALAMESTAVLDIKKRYPLFIGGKWCEPVNGHYFKVVSPATGEIIAEVAQAGRDDVNAAVEAAKIALIGDWSEMAGIERGKCLFKLARLIQERAKEFAVLESLDGGKPIKESRDVDIPQAAAHFFYHAGWADKLEHVHHARSRPVGVCAQVIPWNFPLLMAAWKLAPALACGNTVVLKPAETTPLTALLLAELIQEAGFPEGVVNMVTGDGRTGDLLVSHGDVDKVAFTGSTAVGKQIQQKLAGTGKRLSLELGGKAAQIIFADAALDQAVEGVIDGIFFNQGHVCCAGSRLLIEESVHDVFITKLKERMKELRVGHSLDKNTDIGAINSEVQLKRITDAVAQGVEEGCELWDTGQKLPDSGYYFRPSLLLGASQSVSAVQKEIFGPVLTVQTFRTPAEAVKMANNTRYGLSGGVWSEKGSKALAVANQVDAGVLWVNCFNQFDPSSPFGGMQESGFGREGGMQGLVEYLQK